MTGILFEFSFFTRKPSTIAGRFPGEKTEYKIRNIDMKKKTSYFSLIELLIVVGILGALSALILPMFHDTEKEAKDTVARTKMKDIQRAFGRFQADMLTELGKKDSDNGETTNLYLEDIALYGLWPLFVRNHPVRTEGDEWDTSTFRKYPAYNTETRFGWRGQYLEYDDIAQIATPALTYSYTGTGSDLAVTSPGAQSPGTDCKIPVLKDPYGGYYRILCPEARTNNGNNLSRYERLKRMVIVCTGPNRKLETTTTSFIDANDDAYVKTINGDDIAPQGDDIIIRLMPNNY